MYVICAKCKALSIHYIVDLSQNYDGLMTWFTTNKKLKAETFTFDDALLSILEIKNSPFWQKQEICLNLEHI